MTKSESIEIPRKSFANSPFGVWALLFFVGVAVYAPALRNEYLFADDYPQFCERQGWHVHAPYGRPLLGVLFLLVPEAPAELASFVLLRGLSLVSTVTFVWLLWQAVLRRMLPERAAVLAALGCLALPTFHFCIGASTAYPIVLAATTSLGAGALAVAALGNEAHPTVRRKFIAPAAAAVLELAGLATYQPAAMCYWLALIPVVLDARFRDDAGFRQRGGLAFGLGMATVAIYLTVFKLAALLALIESPPRVDLTTDIVGKLTWFIEKPLIRALSLWGLYEWRHVVAGGTVVVLAAAHRATTMRRGGPRNPRDAARRLAAGALPLLCYAPVMATAESWPSYRSLIALSVFVYVLAAVAAHRIYITLSTALRGALVAGCCLAIVVASYAANRNVADNIVDVQHAELNYLLASLKATQASPTPPRAIHVVMSPFDRGADFPCRSDEFGVRSASRPRWTIDMTRCAQRLLGLNERPVTVSAPGDPSQVDARVLVVDMNRIRWRR